MNDELTQLADKYRADKSPNIKHGYTPYYYNLLKDRKQSIQKVVEIGAGEGASLRMWREFFPNAQIYAADNQDNRIFTDDRIQVFKSDQSKILDNFNLIMEHTGVDVDLFVDDGSHKPEDQFLSCITIMPLLKKDAIYIIEDVDDMCANLMNTLLGSRFDTEMVKFGSRHDDRIIVVRHKINPEESIHE